MSRRTPSWPNCVSHVAWSRFWPKGDRSEFAPEAPGERDALVAAVKTVHGPDVAKRFVDTMFATGYFSTPEAAVDCCVRHGLVEGDLTPVTGPEVAL